MKFTLFSLSVLSMTPLDVFGHLHVPFPYGELLSDGLTAATASIAGGFANTDRSATFQDGRLLRQLEFTEACNNTYNMLWEDEALKDAKSLLDRNLLTARDQYLVNLEDSCIENGNDVTCTLSEPDGTQEFRSACTTAKGEIIMYPLDYACDITLEGEQFNIYLDLPSILDCVPTTADFDGCTDDLLVNLGLVSSFLASTMEDALSSDGTTPASCTVGDVIPSSASDNAVQAVTQTLLLTLVAVIAPIIFR